MACTMDMFAVVKIPAPKGPIPDGMKITALQSPDSGQSAPASPVLAVGGFTLWPMSYYDNRVSFGMVMYDLKWNVVGTHEMPGARYIYDIKLNGEGETGTVTFIGQANQSVSMTPADICALLY